MNEVMRHFGGVSFATIHGSKEPEPPDVLQADWSYRLALVVKNKTNPAYISAMKAADDVAARFGIEVAHFVPEVADDLAEQSALMQSIIESGDYQGMVFTPVDTEAQVPLIEAANRAGLPLYNFSNQIAGGELVTFVGSDDVAIGREIIGWLANAAGGRARIIVLDGSPGTPTARDRLQGVHEALQHHSGLEVLAEAPAFYDRGRAAEITAQLLGQHSDADAIVALNDEMALGAAQAVAAAGRAGAVRITGVNGTPAGLLALRDGVIAATVDYALYAMAGLSVELAIRHLNGERIPHQSQLLPAPVIDANNVAAVIEERQRWGIM